MYLILILIWDLVWGEHSRIQNYSAPIGKTISTTTMGAYVLYSGRNM